MKKKFVIDSEKASTGVLSGNSVDRFTVKIPKNVLPKKPVAVELIDYSGDLTLELIGTSNNKFDIIRNDIRYNIVVNDIVYTSPADLEAQINTVIQTTLGISTLGINIIRLVNFTELRKYSVTQRYRYDFTSTDAIPFILDFDVADSFGPFVGFGKSTTKSKTSHTSYGINVFNQQQYELSYNAIDVFNVNNRIQLLTDAGVLVKYVTITNPLFYFDDITTLAEFLESQFNTVSGSFSPAASFRVTHSDQTGRITIENLTGALFQINFVLNNFGSMNELLGFRKSVYKGRNVYVGEPINIPPLVFPESYVFICSDLLNSSDSAPIIMGNEDVENKDVLFVVPGDKKYYKESGRRQLIDIRSSKINTEFDNADSSGYIDVEFYIRTFSGLHVNFLSKWQFSFNMYFDDSILDGIKQQKMLIMNSSYIQNGFPHDFNVSIPPVFSTPPVSIELLNANIRATPIVLANNTKFNVIRNGVTYNINIPFATEISLASTLKDLINSELATEVGQFNPGSGNINRIEVSISVIIQAASAFEINTLTGSVFTFTSNDAIPFELDFNVEDSIGTLLGFSERKTDSATLVSGVLTKDVSEIIGTLTSYVADPHNPLNINNSFELIDDNKTLVAKIKLSSFTSYTDTNVFLSDIRDAMNVYSSSFTPTAVFSVYYDHESNSVVIENTSTAKFGLVFNFSGFGSLADILGFSDSPARYMHKTRYVAKPTEFFPRTRDESDIYIVSTDLAGGIDEVTVPLYGRGVTDSNILFTVPGRFNNINKSSFTTSSNVFEEKEIRQIINIEHTKFAHLVKQRTSNNTIINFQLKLASGASLHLNSEWTAVMIIRS